MSRKVSVRYERDGYPKKPRRMSIMDIHERMCLIADLLDDLADEVAAHIMKKTTQRSPEFHGGANC